jgi:hypothetical protein
MYKLSTSLLGLFLAVTSFAQNIVHNPGFEEFTSCPGNTSQLNKATGWESPNFATPDFYHSCSSVNAGVPDNSFGSQYPATGDGYAGLISYLTAGGYKEYLEGHMDPMQPGKYYKVSMKVSLSEINRYANAGLGVLFSVDSAYASPRSTDVLSYKPQVDFSSYGVLTEKDKWVTLTDYFYADSAYKFITIGCFIPDSMVTKKAVNYGNQPGAYYYIDDVVVETAPMGVALNPGKGFYLFPHPLLNSSEVHFNNPDGNVFVFSVYNALGQLVKCITNIRTEEFIIQRDALASGVYYYHMSSTGSEEVYTGKLMVGVKE